MSKYKQRKNVYAFFKAKDFRYTSVEAVDDNGNLFLYTLNDGNHESYLRSAKEMCEQYESFCKNTCGLYDARYCDIWTLDYFSPLPDDFEYESLFDESTIGTEDYEHNLEIYSEYSSSNLDLIIGKCDYACGQYLSTQYGVKSNHIKNPDPFAIFLEKNMPEQSAYGVKAVVAIYKKHIDKNKFTAEELANIKTYMLNNINVIFEIFDRRTVITREKLLIYYALYEAALRLYKCDNRAFKEIIHELLDKINGQFRRANSAVYAFIFNFFYDYEKRYYGKPFECTLSDRSFPSDFCSAEDMLRIKEMIRRNEGGLD